MKVRRFAYMKARVNSLYRLIYRRLRKKSAPRRKVNGMKVIHDVNACNEYIFEKIRAGKPFMAGRFGSTELSVINNYYRRVLDPTIPYAPTVRRHLQINAGFFPEDEALMDDFSELMLQDCANLDLIGLWNDKMEMFTISEYAPNARGVDLFCLEPYYGDMEKSWTRALEGKTLLVVHPFAETIEKQFEKKDKIYPKGFWPDCKLVTVKAVQTIAGEKDEQFENWFDALHYMERQIDEKDFDVAIIGCGAYGFPLASYIKSKGKQAIHLGGAVQLLFGIKGKRWEGTEIEMLFNEHWVRPAVSETPKNKKIVEEGCYW